MNNEQLDNIIPQIATLGEPEAEDNELTEELAATATIDSLFDNFVTNVHGWLMNTVEVSEQGNPVRTHLSLLSLSDDIVTEAYELQRALIDQIAKRGEEIAVQGADLRKQVIEEN